LLEGGGVAFCTLDYGHGPLHANGRRRWLQEWPPPVACTGCGALDGDCRPLWPSSRKCCPDCSHE
jgi:hypothetical protein